MANEKRLIDANAEIASIKECICKNCNSHNGIRCRACWVDDAIGFLDDAPTVDAVEVVRCKDCVNWHKDTLFCDYMPCGDGQERVIWYDTDFCSYGERRTDNE